MIVKSTTIFFQVEASLFTNYRVKAETNISISASELERIFQVDCAIECVVHSAPFSSQTFYVHLKDAESKKKLLSLKSIELKQKVLLRNVPKKEDNVIVNLLKKQFSLEQKFTLVLQGSNAYLDDLGYEDHQRLIAYREFNMDNNKVSIQSYDGEVPYFKCGVDVSQVIDQSSIPEIIKIVLEIFKNKSIYVFSRKIVREGAHLIFPLPTEKNLQNALNLRTIDIKNIKCKIMKIH